MNFKIEEDCPFLCDSDVITCSSETENINTRLDNWQDEEQFYQEIEDHFLSENYFRRLGAFYG